MATSVSGRSQTVASSAKKLRKVLVRLENKIKEGSYYEALQTYRALYGRYCAQGNEQQALSLLVEGASTLLKHGQYESGTDLAVLMVTHFKKHHTPISQETLGMIHQLFVLYKPPVLPSAGEEDAKGLLNECAPREVFMRAALKWSSMVGGEGCKYGHPYLHKILALNYWECRQYVNAREHFQYACVPEDYGQMLVEVSTSHGRPREADLFLAQAVLQLLALKDRRSALGVYTVYTQTHPTYRSREGPPYDQEALLNLLWFLMLATERGDKEVFSFLRSKYQNVLTRDPCFSEYLDKIGFLYFGSVQEGGKTGSSRTEGGLGGLFSSLLGAIAPASGTQTAPPERAASMGTQARASSGAAAPAAGLGGLLGMLRGGGAGSGNSGASGAGTLIGNLLSGLGGPPGSTGANRSSSNTETNTTSKLPSLHTIDDID